jgi:hypothetical protein
MKKYLQIVLIFISASFCGGQEAETIFIGIPSVKISEGGVERVPQVLKPESATPLRVVISKIGNDYFWATRENVKMIKIESSGAFITYLALNGSGYVRVIKPEDKQAASLMSDTEKTFDYVEHMTLGLRSVTYFGSKQ